MKLEEVLPAYRLGQECRHTESGHTLTEFLKRDYISHKALMSDKWELVPRVIDLVEYAEGYEFELGKKNSYINLGEDKEFNLDHDFTIKTLGCAYMTKDKAEELAKKLNSGEWVLK